MKGQDATVYLTVAFTTPPPESEQSQRLWRQKNSRQSQSFECNAALVAELKWIHVVVVFLLQTVQ